MGRNASFDAFFYPRNIAIVGASNKEGKMGNLFVQHLVNHYSGKIVPINPVEQEVAGLRAYSNISTLSEQFDLAIPLIPQDQLINFIQSCRRGQVKFLLAISSGFGEVPPEGKALQEELVRIAGERGMRVVGPNSLGMLNCLFGLNASMVPELPPGGPGLSCITQSGGFGMAVYMYAFNHQLQISKFCDLGNTSDVQIDELLQYFHDDADTRAVGLFLESVPRQGAFDTHACALAIRKPLIIAGIGRTEAGRRASLAHLGIESDCDIIQELERKGRIIPARTGLEMLHIAKGLSWQPLPRGQRVGIITGSGGIGAELADLCVEHGLEVPEFSRKLQYALRPHLPSYASVQNPVDITPIWWKFPEIYPPLIQTLMTCSEIDILLITIIDVAATLETLPYAVIEALGLSQHNNPSLKPIYIYWASSDSMVKNMRILEKAHIPCYQSTLDTAQVASAISKYGINYGARTEKG